MRGVSTLSSSPHVYMMYTPSRIHVNSIQYKLLGYVDNPIVK